MGNENSSPTRTNNETILSPHRGYGTNTPNHPDSFSGSSSSEDDNAILVLEEKKTTTTRPAQTSSVKTSPTTTYQQQSSMMSPSIISANSPAPSLVVVRERSASNASSVASSSSSVMSLQGDMTIDAENGYLVHHVQPSDTLQGLSIRYGTKIQDIKRANGMWTGNDIWMKKSLLIPIDAELFYQRKREKIEMRRGALCQMFVESAKQHMKEVGQQSAVQKVEPQIDVNVAKQYLEKSRWQLENALSAWQADLFRLQHDYANEEPGGNTKVETLDTSTKQQLEQKDNEIFDL